MTERRVNSGWKNESQIRIRSARTSSWSQAGGREERVFERERRSDCFGSVYGEREIFGHRRRWLKTPRTRDLLMPYMRVAPATLLPLVSRCQISSRIGAQNFYGFAGLDGTVRQRPAIVDGSSTAAAHHGIAPSAHAKATAPMTRMSSKEIAIHVTDFSSSGIRISLARSAWRASGRSRRRVALRQIRRRVPRQRRR